MQIQRLQWAGVMVKSRQASVMIDPMYSSFSQRLFGENQEPFYPLEEFGNVDLIAVTHLHSDHFDPEAIKKAFGDEIIVLVPVEGAEIARQKGLKNVRGVNREETVEHKGMRVTAVHSSDGVGDPQVAWVVEADGRRIIHCGDTLWHGQWWNIARQLGPFDAACLPVNGAVIEEPGAVASGQPICLTPEQAVAAASVLGAELLIPIHFGSFHNPPFYSQTPHLLERLEASAADKKVSLRLLQHKESMLLESVRP